MPKRDETGIRGCLHIHMVDGEIKNIFSHLGDLPENGVVHLVPSDNYTIEEFKKSHIYDHGELDVPSSGGIYQLGSRSIIVKDGIVSTKLLLPDDDLDAKDK